MRVLIAPDSYGNSLTAPQAADAIAQGWTSTRPHDHIIKAPQSDGGPGFITALASTGGTLHTTETTGPLGEKTTAQWLLHNNTAYLETAQVAGLASIPHKPNPTTATTATTAGLAPLITAAIKAGAHTIVIGLGGSASTDGGRGLIAALGGTPDHHGLTKARHIIGSVKLIAATDVDNKLLGPQGAAAVFGPQKGADKTTVAQLEATNTQWATIIGETNANTAGAGAAGGLGAGLFALGATRESGAHIVAEANNQRDVLSTVGLLVTGEGRFDQQSLGGKVVISLAQAAKEFNVPVIVLAGQIDLTEQQIRHSGIEKGYAMADFCGDVDTAISQAKQVLSKLAGAVAKNYPQPL